MKICEAGRDSCGCDNWKKGIRTINGQYPDDNRDFDINAGAGVSITPATGGITVGLTAPLPGGMTFMGTVGTGGTIATLPNADVTNRGFCYVAISAGTTPDTPPKSYDLGDMLVSNGVEWIVIPSGDDPVAWSQITGKPTTVSGYGITDAVDTSSAQTAGGAKTWSGQQIATGQRTYNASNTTDVVTIGSLQASSDVVHRSGNEDIGGSKSFLQSLTIKDDRPTLTNPSSDFDLPLLRVLNPTLNKNMFSLYIQYKTDGSAILWAYTRNNNDTGNYTQIAVIRSAQS